MSDYPETLQDELEAYPLRLNVAALPERRFFRMIRTLTVGVVLLSALLISFGVYLNYQITHLDVTVQRGKILQFYQIDPVDKRLKAVESVKTKVDPLKLVVEEKLRDYLQLRNSTVWVMDTMNKRFGAKGLIAQMSHPKVYNDFFQVGANMIRKTRASELVRDVHIYDLRMESYNPGDRLGASLYDLDGKNRVLWSAIIETFDLPITDDLVSVCNCSDNSKACIKCKIDNAKNRERSKIWMRTSFSRQKRCDAKSDLCANPLGVSVDSYIVTFMPIHDDATYWNLPPALQPEI